MVLIKAVVCNRYDANREEHIEQMVISVDPWKGVNYSSARVLCLCSSGVDTPVLIYFQGQALNLQVMTVAE